MHTAELKRSRQEQRQLIQVGKGSQSHAALESLVFYLLQCGGQRYRRQTFAAVESIPLNLPETCRQRERLHLGTFVKSLRWQFFQSRVRSKRD